MMDDGPVGEAMSREGKGTAAASEAGNTRPVTWEQAQRRLTKGGSLWVATVRPDGAPHVLPVLAVADALGLAPADDAHQS